MRFAVPPCLRMLLFLAVPRGVAPGSAAAAAIEAKNQIRASIRALFPNRKCFTLVRPAADEHTLRHLGQLPPTAATQPLPGPDDGSATAPATTTTGAGAGGSTKGSSDGIRPEFVQGVADLAALVFASAGVKRIGPHAATGSMIATLTTIYVKAMNAGAQQQHLSPPASDCCSSRRPSALHTAFNHC